MSKHVSFIQGDKVAFGFIAMRFSEGRDLKAIYDKKNPLMKDMEDDERLDFFYVSKLSEVVTLLSKDNADNKFNSLITSISQAKELVEALENPTVTQLRDEKQKIQQISDNPDNIKALEKSHRTGKKVKNVLLGIVTFGVSAIASRFSKDYGRRHFGFFFTLNIFRKFLKSIKRLKKIRVRKKIQVKTNLRKKVWVQILSLIEIYSRHVLTNPNFLEN